MARLGDDRFADHRGNIQPGPSLGDCCCWPGYVHIDGKKSLVCAHRWQEKLGGCTSLARSAMIDLPTIEGTASSPLPWGLLLARLGDDHSRNIQPGPLPWGLLLLARSALITRGTSNRVPPVGTAAAGPVMCTSMARKAWCVHIDGKKSLVCAHRWQEKLGVCTSLARSALITRSNSNQVPMGYPGGRHSWNSPRGSTKCCC